MNITGEKDESKVYTFFDSFEFFQIFRDDFKNKVKNEHCEKQIGAHFHAI